MAFGLAVLYRCIGGIYILLTLVYISQVNLLFFFLSLVQNSGPPKRGRSSPTPSSNTDPPPADPCELALGEQLFKSSCSLLCSP